MLRRYVGIALLLAFLLWRAANSLVVCATDTRVLTDWRAGVADDAAQRIARGLLLFPDTPGTPLAERVHYQRYRLLDDHLPERSKVFFLRNYSGVADYWEVASFFRISALIYPRDSQMTIEVPPLIRKSAVHPWSRKRYILDIRRNRRPLGDGFVKVAENPGGVLWRQDPR